MDILSPLFLWVSCGVHCGAYATSFSHDSLPVQRSIGQRENSPVHYTSC